MGECNPAFSKDIQRPAGWTRREFIHGKKIAKELRIGSVVTRGLHSAQLDNFSGEPITLGHQLKGQARKGLETRVNPMEKTLVLTHPLVHWHVSGCAAVSSVPQVTYL